MAVVSVLQVEQLAKRVLNNPVEIQVGHILAAVSRWHCYALTCSHTQHQSPPL